MSHVSSTSFFFFLRGCRALPVPGTCPNRFGCKMWIASSVTAMLSHYSCLKLSDSKDQMYEEQNHISKLFIIQVWICLLFLLSLKIAKTNDAITPIANTVMYWMHTKCRLLRTASSLFVRPSDYVMRFKGLWIHYETGLLHKMFKQLHEKHSLLWGQMLKVIGSLINV